VLRKTKWRRDLMKHKFRFFPPSLTIDEKYSLLNGEKEVVSNRKIKIFYVREKINGVEFLCSNAINLRKPSN
jgi:hypothetical protein